MFSSTSWIAIAPGRLLITVDWMTCVMPSSSSTVSGMPSLSSMFSWKRGEPTETPSRLIIPGELISDGTRESSNIPRRCRSPGDSRLFSMIGPPATVRTPACILGSIAIATLPTAVRAALRVQVALPVAGHIHPDSDDPHDLHQVHGRLSDAVREKDDAPWRGSADALAVSDNTVAILVDPATARGERHRLADGLVDRQRPERAEAVPDGIDVDGGDPLCRQRSGEKLHVLLAEGGSVTDDRHRPTILGHRSGRQREVKVDLVGPLQFWRSGPRPNRRDVLAGVDLVVGREILPEDKAAHSTGEDVADQGEVEVDGFEDRGIDPCLLTPGNARHLFQQEHRPLTLRPQQEIARGGGSCFDLIADFLKDRRGALRREHAGDSDVVANPDSSRRVDGFEQ